MKLIIINGSPAAGKSTLANSLHESIPLSLLADIDSWRKLVSNWRENREESLRNSYVYSVAAVDAYLSTGHSVIVDKAILSDDSVIDTLIESGKKHRAQTFELILTADRETIIKRAAERGFHAGGLLTPTTVVELWEQTQVIKKRPNAIVIDTTNISADELFNKVLKLTQ